MIGIFTNICKICKQKTIDSCGRNIIGSHVKEKHNLSRQQYYDLYFKKRKDGLCKICEEKKIKWKYEPKRFSLQNCRKLNYLPDFYLPKHKLYIEIKPKKFITKELFDIKKCFKQQHKKTLEILSLENFQDFFNNLLKRNLK